MLIVSSLKDKWVDRIRWMAFFWGFPILYAGSVCAGGARVEGVLFEKGTRTPLSGVRVYCIPEEDASESPSPTPKKAVTDEEGRFAFDDVQPGEVKWVINFAGYKRFEKYSRFSGNEGTIQKKFYLEKNSYQVYETTIYDRGDKRDEKTKSLSREAFSKLPGSGGDPIKAVQNLPGVNRVASFSSQVVIEGSAPQDTRYSVDGHEVPIIFHFGGLSSVMMPESLDRVDYFSAGYGPEYGRTLSGVIGLWTRQPKTDRIQGFAFADIFNVGGAIEGPLSKQSKSSFFLGFRQSYIGAVLKQVAKNNSDFNLTAAPDFADLTGIYQTEISPIDSFRLVTLGSKDTFEFVLKEPFKQDPALRGSFSSLTAFFRLIPELTHRHGQRTLSRWSLGLGRDWVRIDTGDNFLHLRTYSLTSRGEVEHQLNEVWKSYWGMDNQMTWAEVEFVLPSGYAAGGVFNPFSTGEKRQAQIKQSSHRIGAYWRNVLHPSDSPWTLIPGGRVDYFNLTKELAPAPRLAVKYAIDESLSLRSAAGLYVQPPQPQEMDSVYGNPDLKSPQAWHATIGAEKDFRNGSSSGWSLSGDLFYKYMQRLVTPSAQFIQRNGVLTPENYANSGFGRAYGFETLVQYSSGSWNGWVAYTLSRSTRGSSMIPEGLSQYDQTHGLTVLQSVELGKNFTLSSRARYFTGNPTTPVVGGVFDADNDVYIPIRGEYFSQRLNPFFQWDLRLDKKWVYDLWVLSAYLDVSNVTNRANSEAVRYSYDYSQSTVVSGLPLLPTFGLKGEF